VIKKKYLIIVLILLGRFAAFSQTQHVYYFDEDFNLVKKSHAFLKGWGIAENGVLELKVFNKKGKTLLLMEHFTDSSLKISNGLFESFFDTKIKQIEGNFLLGKQDGLWRVWDKDGSIIDSSFFDNGEKTMQTTFDYYLDGKLMDVKIDSIRSGKESTIYFDESGNKVFTRTGHEATFPGGMSAWGLYITEKVQSYLEELKLKENFATCLIKIMINKDSSISKVEAITMKGTKLSQIAMSAIINGPKWIPTQENGRNVDSYKILPITILKTNQLYTYPRVLHPVLIQPFRENPY
jgi:hypothetical protein